MKPRNRFTWCAVLLPAAALAQVQNPPNSVPIGEGRLPTESGNALTRPGGDDCNRQAQALRDQFAIQEQNVRREMAEQLKTAPESDKERIRQRAEQRLSALKLEQADAISRVMATCRG